LDFFHRDLVVLAVQVEQVKQQQTVEMDIEDRVEVVVVDLLTDLPLVRVALVEMVL
jgi:hypothetical protein